MKHISWLFAVTTIDCRLAFKGFTCSAPFPAAVRAER